MVVLIPPAVDPGLPPINMRNMVSILLLSVSAAVSTVLNPAVLAVTEPNKELSTFPWVDIPSSVFWLSNRYRSAAPPITRIAVVTSTILV